MKGLTPKQIVQLINIAGNIQNQTSTPVFDEVAFVTLMRICRDYVTPGLYPAIPDDERDKWFMDRLNKFRVRFFEKI